MRGVKDLLVSGEEEESLLSPRSFDSIPESICRELILDLATKYLPDELVDYEMFPKVRFLCGIFFCRSGLTLM